MLPIKIILLLLLLVPVGANATIIFQDNFDTCTTNCNSAGDDYWDQWTRDGGTSLNIGGVTHYSGEISSTGRGGTGKSYKIWRNGTSWIGNFTGGLVIADIGGNYRDIWMRYYFKMPTAMTLSGTEYVKMWMLNPLGELSLYCDITSGGTELSLIDYTHSPILTTVVVPAADFNTKFHTGNWVCVQWHFNNTTSPGTIELYLDGALQYRNTNYDWDTNARWQVLQHFHIGNAGDSMSWQSGWQALEIDDFIIATTKAETDPDGGGIAPATATGLTITGGTIR